MYCVDANCVLQFNVTCMGWCCSMVGSSQECSLGKVRITSMQGTIYLLGTKYHMVLTQIAPVALHVCTVLHMIYGKAACIPATTPRQPITLMI